MIIQCGPTHDQRELSFSLPSYVTINSAFVERLYSKTERINKNYRIGCLVSGGLDSALLYYLLLLENQQSGNKFTITPYTILRKEGSRHFAIKVIEYVNKLFDIPTQGLNIVGDNTISEMAQVSSGVEDIFKDNDFAYLGIIEARPEHSVNWNRPDFRETYKVRYPLLNLQKSHIVDLIYKTGIQAVLPLTHSCAVDELNACGHCNGCRERAWGFMEVNRRDSKFD